MRFFSDEAIVLRKRPVKERDELVTLLTLDRGKISLLAYGSRDPKSRKVGGLEVFQTILFSARRSRDHLPGIEQVQLLNARAFSMFEAEDGLERFQRGCEILRLTDLMISEDLSCPAVFSDLNAALDSIHEPLVAPIYHIRLLSQLGHLPDWSRCIHCTVKLSREELSHFCGENRGFSHERCCRLAKKACTFSSAVTHDFLKVMSYWQRFEIREGVRVQLRAEMIGQSHRFSQVLEREMI